MKNVYLLLFLILACSCNELKEGTITKKYTEPEHDYLYMLPIAHTISTGKTTSIYFTYIPVMMHDDEDFVIEITGKNHLGENLIEHFYTSKERYNKLDIGKFICVDETCNREPNEDTKK